MHCFRHELPDEFCIVLDGVSPADAAALCDEADTFHCDSSLCIDGDKKCNGVSECRNGIDESVATCGE